MVVMAVTTERRGEGRVVTLVVVVEKEDKL